MSEPLTLGEFSLELAAPRSLAACYEVLAIKDSHPLRCVAAALGLCWPGPDRRPAWRYETHYDAKRFGGEVIDALAKRGVDVAEISRVGVMALELVGDQVLDGREVDQLAGNSEAPAASTS